MAPSAVRDSNLICEDRRPRRQRNELSPRRHAVNEAERRNDRRNPLISVVWCLCGECVPFLRPTPVSPAAVASATSPRNRGGVTPNARRKERVKWLWLEPGFERERRQVVGPRQIDEGAGEAEPREVLVQRVPSTAGTRVSDTRVMRRRPGRRRRGGSGSRTRLRGMLLSGE